MRLTWACISYLDMHSCCLYNQVQILKTKIFRSFENNSIYDIGSNVNFFFINLRLLVLSYLWMVKATNNLWGTCKKGIFQRGIKRKKLLTNWIKKNILNYHLGCWSFLAHNWSKGSQEPAIGHLIFNLTSKLYRKSLNICLTSNFSRFFLDTYHIR